MKSIPASFSLVALLLCSCVAPCLAAEPPSAAAFVEVNVNPDAKVKVQIPAGWEKIVTTQGNLSTTVRMSSPSKEVVMLLTFMQDLKGTFVTQEKVNEAARGANERNVEGSVEKKITLVEVMSKSGLGAYAITTDAKLVGVETLRPGSFRCVAQGLFAMKGKALAAVTVLGNDPKSAEFQQALKVIADGISM